MSYAKKTWKTGDTITAAALNNLETGASANAEAIADIEAALPTYVGEKVTRKAAATITPGTADQTIAANQYLTGAQTIEGDGNLSAGNIKKGVSIFGVTGTLESGSGSGAVVKTGTFKGAGGAVEVDTGLSSISYFIAYDAAKTIHAQGIVVAIMDSAHNVSGLGVSCTSYSQYLKNFGISTSDVLTVSGGKVSFPGASTTNAPISNATYNWVAVGEA